MMQTTELSGCSSPPFGETREEPAKKQGGFKSCSKTHSVVFFLCYEAPMKRLIWNRHTKLLVKHAIGWSFIVFGLIMLVTPGQGILSILIGIYLLADEIPLFGKMREWIHHRFPKASDYVHQMGDKFRQRLHRKTKP
jgi:hypothetical protein